MPKRTDTPQSYLKFPLVDNGLKSGRELCSHLLACGDFGKSTLGRFGRKSRQKEQLAADLADQVIGGALNPDDIAMEFCRQDRMWLAIWPGTIRRRASGLRTAQDFLTHFGPMDGAWYGPFFDKDANVDRYVYTHGFRNYLPQGNNEPPLKVRIRWHAVAEVREDYIALHWNNFSHSNEVDKAGRATQFAYWEWVPHAVNALASAMDAKIDVPNMHTIVLDRMRADYGHKKDVPWTHRRIRAEKDGVALNAHSGGDLEINVRGLQSLTSALAHHALRAMGRKSDDPKRIDVEEALLITLLQRWGTRSYEFSIGNKFERVFRAHVFFGAKPNEMSQDRFPHLLCYKEFGGSTGTCKFLLPYILS